MKGLDYLKDFCDTNRQAEILQITIDSESMRAAAESLGVHHSVVARSINRMKIRAARAGKAPGHWDDGVAPGYSMGKVTVQRGPDGVERVWERQHPEALALDSILEAIQDRAEGLPPLPPEEQPAPPEVDSDLCTTYFISDLHLGMLAWGKEGGSPWDLRIAVDVLVNAIVSLAESSPPSEIAILSLLGDFVHWDGVYAVTPTSKNVLDSDIRYPKLQYAALEVVEKVVKLLLRKHKRVRLVESEGNHDLASASWIRIAMSRIFADWENVEVDLLPCPYTAYLHGEIMLGFHHGHRKRGKRLPGIFASEPRFREMWGKAKYTYIHTGHLHSSELLQDENGGAVVERHPTLAARDSFATGLGAVSVRAARAITYHKTRGEVYRVTTYPEFEENK